MGIDFGLKRMGFAVGNTMTRTAQPLAHVNCHKSGPDWTQIRSHIEEWQPAVVVIGLPVSLQGDETEMSRMARKFGAELEKRFDIAVTFTDERLTSNEADRIIRERTPEGRKIESGRSGTRDSIAAQLIVQTYMEDNRAHG